MKRTILLTLSCMLIITGLLAVVSCSSSSQTTTPPATTPSQSNAVTIQNLSFSPANITVSVGTKVTWTNKDSVTHTVTSDTGLFDSGQLSPGSTFSYTFNNKGVFNYHCTIHATMHGTVTVE
jgi:plastocyanin